MTCFASTIKNFLRFVTINTTPKELHYFASNEENNTEAAMCAILLVTNLLNSFP